MFTEYKTITPEIMEQLVESFKRWQNTAIRVYALPATEARWICIPTIQPHAMDYDSGMEAEWRESTHG